MLIERELLSHINKFVQSPEAVVVTGMRRVGKTTLLRQIQHGLGSSNTLFFDLENPVYQRHFEQADYDRILDVLKSMGLSLSRQAFVFLDEIQNVKSLPSVVKYLIDHYGIKFFMTGSSSFYLKNLFSESLSGRKFIFELFPMNFREFLSMKAPNTTFDGDVELSSSLFDHFDRYYQEYLLYGGFPGVVARESRDEKLMLLDDVFSSYFNQEVRQLGDFRKTGIIRNLMLLLMERAGSQLDIQKLSSELGVSRETVYHYLAFLEQTYFVSLIRPFSRNRDNEIRKVPKCYVCDTGMARHFSRADEGSLFENAIFLALRTRGELQYYRKKSGAEIDFVVNRKSAYEVKLTARDEDVHKLKRIAESLDLEEYSVISRKYYPHEHVSYGFML